MLKRRVPGLLPHARWRRDARIHGWWRIDPLVQYRRVCRWLDLVGPVSKAGDDPFTACLVGPIPGEDFRVMPAGVAEAGGQHGAIKWLHLDLVADRQQLAAVEPA